MALQLDKTTPEGFTVSYWRVDPNISYDAVEQKLHARVLVYANATARQNDKRPVIFNDAEFRDIEIAILSGSDAVNAISTGEPRDAVYDYLKTLPFFDGYQDV